MAQAQVSSVQVEGGIERSLGYSGETSADSGSRKTMVSVPLAAGTEVSKTIAAITAIQSIIAEIHGPVTIENMKVKVIGMKAGDGVGFVLTRTGGSISEKNFWQKPNARKTVYTSFNAGATMEYDVPIPAGLAKQLSPVSGQFPGLDFYIKSYGEAEITVFFELGIHGDRFVTSAGF